MAQLFFPNKKMSTRNFVYVCRNLKMCIWLTQRAKECLHFNQKLSLFLSLNAIFCSVDFGEMLAHLSRTQQLIDLKCIPPQTISNRKLCRRRRCCYHRRRSHPIEFNRQQTLENPFEMYLSFDAVKRWDGHRSRSQILQIMEKNN